MRYKHFTKDERNELAVLLKKGYSIRDIADALKKNPSSVSREITKHSTKGQYHPKEAHRKARIKRNRSKYCGMKIRGSPWLEDYIKDKLVDGWTPEQIAGRLALENGGRTVITFKSIYKWLDTPYGNYYVRYLPSKRYRKRKKKKEAKREIIKNRVFIEQRPNIINARKRLKDFEGDVLGTTKSEKERLAGAVDRKALYLLAEKIPRLKETMAAFDKMLKPHNPLSITLDNGPENAKYETLDIPTFFCHPYSAWEKPLIENTFQRLRRYIPKKAKLSNYTDGQISAIVDKMNNTPRKRLGFKTPKEVFFNQPIQLQLLIYQSNECCTSG